MMSYLRKYWNTRRTVACTTFYTFCIFSQHPWLPIATCSSRSARRMTMTIAPVIKSAIHYAGASAALSECMTLPAILRGVYGVLRLEGGELVCTGMFTADVKSLDPSRRTWTKKSLTPNTSQVMGKERHPVVKPIWQRRSNRAAAWWRCHNFQVKRSTGASLSGRRLARFDHG